MKIFKSILLWVLAFALMLTIGTYQRKTGPTYPISGQVKLGDVVVDYQLDRSHGGEGTQPVILEISDPDIKGTVFWKRYKYDEPLHILPMEVKKTGGIKRSHRGQHEFLPLGSGEEVLVLTAELPHQPPAGKLEYEVVLEAGGEKIQLPESGKSAVIRFKGLVPLYILIPHIFCMFFAVMFSMRLAIAALLKEKMKTIAWITFILLCIGGLILGPVVQKHAFDAYWTGWPFGEDLTDNKTLAAVIGYLVALYMMRGKDGEKRGRWWAVGAATIMLAVYLIPHSMRGSELDYNTLEQQELEKTAPVQVQTE